MQQGKAQFSALQLPPRTRELIILTTASVIECQYEIVQHQPIAEAAGVSSQACDAVVRQDFGAACLSAHDRAVTRFTADVARNPRVSDDVFAEVHIYLGSREIVEALQVIGYYWSFGRICTVLNVEVDGPHGTSVVDAVQRKQAH